MIGPEELYPSSAHGITVLVDADEEAGARFLAGLAGERCVVVEDLVPPRFYVLTMFAGGASEAGCSW